MNSKQLSKLGLFTALFVILSWIAIPLPFGVPFTLQVLGVFLVTFFLGESAWMVLLTYLILGTAGLPVFANFSGGIGKLIGPTGGFLIGFFVASGMGMFKKMNKLVMGFIQVIIIYTFGVLWFKTYIGMDLINAFMKIVPSFILFDIAKLIIAFIIYKLVLKSYPKLAEEY